MDETVPEWDAARERARLRRENEAMRRELRAVYAMLGVLATMTPFPEIAVELACAAAGVNAENPALELPTGLAARR